MDEGETEIRIAHASCDPLQSADTAYRILLSRMTRADESALVEFYRSTASRVYAFILRIAGHPLADEVVSDVYFQVWQQAKRYDLTRGSVLAWLLTIARTRSLDALRRREPAELHPQPEDLRPDLYRNDHDPQSLLLALERDSAIYAAVQRLSDAQRRVIELGFFKGLSHSDIAQFTGWPLGTVKTLLRQAMARLQEGLSIFSDRRLK